MAVGTNVSALFLSYQMVRLILKLDILNDVAVTWIVKHFHNRLVISCYILNEKHVSQHEGLAYIC